jgi:60kDa lysophospholipase
MYPCPLLCYLTDRLIDNNHTQCALTKLTYLLSKSELSIADVRSLMGTPLRGELTRSEGAHFAHPTMDQDLQLVQDLLGQIMRLSSQGPTRLSSSYSGGSVSSPSSELHGPEHTLTTTRAVAAAWSWTASEATSASASLLPYLIHMAVSRNDDQSLEAYLGPASATGAHRIAVPGGLINCLEPTSNRAPIHVAALNGSLACK